jgi:hypothetical protein
MSTSTKLLLAAAIVGGVCGVVGAALYVRWRAATRTTTDRASAVLRQLTDVADRMEQTLERAAPA